MGTMKKILITGSTGFVGKTLIPYLYHNGYEDLGLVVRNVKKTEKLFGDIFGSLTIIDNSEEDWNQKYRP